MSDDGRQRAFCAYCGRVIRHGRTCAAHRDLAALDPFGRSARQPLREAELGVSNPWKVPKRGGREELY